MEIEGYNDNENPLYENQTSFNERYNYLRVIFPANTIHILP
jgi:hypothetical protein